MRASIHVIADSQNDQWKKSIFFKKKKSLFVSCNEIELSTKQKPKQKSYLAQFGRHIRLRSTSTFLFIAF